MKTLLMMAVVLVSSVLSFTAPLVLLRQQRNPHQIMLNARGAKGGSKRDDLSAIESRDMTREEMKRFNEQSAKDMDNGMAVMTAASLFVSLPILYLCWVAFHSD